MSKIRVHELAKELGKDNKEILSFLAERGIEVKSHMSSIENEQMEIVKKELGKAEKTEASAAPKKKNITQVFHPQNSRTGIGRQRSKQGKGQRAEGQQPRQPKAQEDQQPKQVKAPEASQQLRQPKTQEGSQQPRQPRTQEGGQQPRQPKAQEASRESRQPRTQEDSRARTEARAEARAEARTARTEARAEGRTTDVSRAEMARVKEEPRAATGPRATEGLRARAATDPRATEDPRARAAADPKETEGPRARAVTGLRATEGPRADVPRESRRLPWR